jgi:hypothetical protein
MSVEVPIGLIAIPVEISEGEWYPNTDRELPYQGVYVTETPVKNDVQGDPATLVREYHLLRDESNTVVLSHKNIKHGGLFRETNEANLPAGNEKAAGFMFDGSVRIDQDPVIHGEHPVLHYTIFVKEPVAETV